MAQSPAEIGRAAEVYEKSGRASFTWRPKSHFQASDFKRFAQDEEVWIAIFGTAIVGTLSLYRSERFIHSLYIDPDAQRLGVGRALVERIRSEVVGPLTLKLDAPNVAAIAFYEATGWRRLTGPDDTGEDEAGVTWQRYRLD
jgi:ribosomal protein S18 acetylase RimI-like enzyme